MSQLGGGYSFSQVPIADIPRSVFNRSHGHKTTMDAGKLVPFFVDEVLPGDTFNVSASVFARLATPLVPIMDNLTMDVFFFFVPNRLLWDNWQRMMGEQDEPGDSIDYLVPQVVAPAGGFAVGHIADYFGIPTGVPNISVSALWFRAYNIIYNEWFRDENLQFRRSVDKGDGPDPESWYSFPIARGKRHDYFTSCLPWPQKGPGVNLPLGQTAPVVADATGIPTYTNTAGTPSSSQPFGMAVGSRNVQYQGLIPDADTNLKWGASTGLMADLSQATSATINTLRQAFQIQKLLERDARGGTRYTEILRSHFGVVSPDARLQRPEFLGGGSIPVTINPVTQTSGTAPDPATGYSATPQGNLAAYGIAGGKGLGFSKSFVEHGVLLGLVAVRADLSYQQGVPKMFSRRSRYDFYWPAFSHLGEQAVLNKEIFAQGTPTDDAVFGYQERWAEYRYYPSKITGLFRSTVAGSLDIWHLAQKFETLPVLDNAFIQDNPPISRISAVPSEPAFLFDSHVMMKCVRPMPTYSVPGLIDHF